MNCGLGSDGNSNLLGIPAFINDLALNANNYARIVCPSLPPIQPDMMIVNEYSMRSKLRLHSDRLTIGASGTPVVSISIVSDMIYCQGICMFIL